MLVISLTHHQSLKHFNTAFQLFCQNKIKKKHISVLIGMSFFGACMQFHVKRAEVANFCLKKTKPHYMPEIAKQLNANTMQ